MASAYLERTATSGNQKTATFSGWFKKCSNGVEQVFYHMRTDSSNFFRIRWDSSDILNGVSRVSGTDYYVTATRKFRDSSAYYNIVFKVDTTQATASDRLKLYVNGEEVTVSASNYPAQNLDLQMNVNSMAQRVGQENGGNYFDGLMTHIHWTDGYAYDASSFGETDSTSGIWKPKTSPSVTYGTNGFFLKMENSSDMGEDSSGNNNDFTTSGTITQTEDTPSNNFCTMNPLRPNSISQTYSNGNNTFIRTGTGGQMNGTLGVMSGKWYYECLIDDYWQYLGWTVLSQNTSQTTACSNSGSGFYGLYSNATDVLTYANGTGTAQGSYTAMASGQIWGIAFDADNAKMYFSVNGVWENSSDPANQTNPAMSSIPVTDFLVPAIGQGTGSRSSTIKINFGNGKFGTTAVASSNSDSAGLGLFEYSVPSGYYSLCTKNIKNYG